MTYHTHQTRPRGGRERDRDISSLGFPFSRAPLAGLHVYTFYSFAYLWERKLDSYVLRRGVLIIGTNAYPIYVSGCLYIGKGKGFAGQVSEDMGWGTRDTIREPGIVTGDGDNDHDNDDARYHRRPFKGLRHRHRRARTKIEFQKKKKKRETGIDARQPLPTPNSLEIPPMKDLPTYLLPSINTYILYIQVLSAWWVGEWGISFMKKGSYSSSLFPSGW